jgi:glycosyltransferase involved in cell wall biosynthesis
VICVARLVPQKSQEVLLAAASRVLPRAGATTFLIVGEGPRLGYLQEEARRLGIASKVVFAGTRNDVPLLMANSDVSALVSTREGFSNVLIESMAAGLPAVVTDVGGNAEAVEDGQSGFLVAPGDVEGVASRLLTLLTDEPLRGRMSAAARARARLFSLDETIRRTEALYDRLLEAKGL